VKIISKLFKALSAVLGARSLQRMVRPLDNIIRANTSSTHRPTHHLGDFAKPKSSDGLLPTLDCFGQPMPSERQLKLERQGENNHQQTHNAERMHRHTAVQIQQLMEMKGERALQAGEAQLVDELLDTALSYGTLIAGETKPNSRRSWLSSPQAASCAEALSGACDQQIQRKAQTPDLQSCQPKPTRHRLAVQLCWWILACDAKWSNDIIISNVFPTIGY
jgi:hypothetical protein